MQTLNNKKHSKHINQSLTTNQYRAHFLPKDDLYKHTMQTECDNAGICIQDLRIFFFKSQFVEILIYLSIASYNSEAQEWQGEKGVGGKGTD